MHHDKPKKYKGINFLKVESQQFNNATRYRKKSKFNSSTLNDLISLKRNKSSKYLLNSLIENSLKIGTDKTLINKKRILYKNSYISTTKQNSSIKIRSPSKIFYSPCKLHSRRINKLGEVKKNSFFNKGDMLVSLFSKDKIRHLKLKKNVSSRNIISDKNLLNFKNKISNKTIIFNNIEPKSSNNIKKSDKTINHKNKINNNIFNNNENENNNNYCENIYIDKEKKENIIETEKNENIVKNENNEKIEKNKENSKCYKNLFCCL